MAYIRVINEDEAEGPLFEIYDQVQQRRGRVSNILRVESLDPKVLQAHLDLYMAIQFSKQGLSRKEREMVAVAVSAANNCRYCVVHHSEALNRYVKDPEWVRNLARDPLKVSMTPREKALVEFALDLNANPGTGRKEGIDKLRKQGLTDEEILQSVQVVCYFSFVNRLASGLGVDLEKDDERDYQY